MSQFFFGPRPKLTVMKLAAANLILTLAGPALAQDALPFELKQIGPGVYTAIDGPKHEAGSNAGFVIGDDGVLVVDALFTPEAAKALVGAYGDLVREVEAADDAPLIDIDTPEALAAYRAR